MSAKVILSPEAKCEFKGNILPLLRLRSIEKTVTRFFNQPAIRGAQCFLKSFPNKIIWVIPEHEISYVNFDWPICQTNNDQ
jgi:hypothetical protein